MTLFKKNKNHKSTSILPSQKGFTLLETLVAIFILTLSITGPVYIASVAFHNTIDSRDNISAQYIAEEVIEVIRNKRDKNTLTSSNNWLQTITDDANCSNGRDESTNKCVMIRNNNDYTFEACSVVYDCPNISLDVSEGNQGAVYGKSDVPTLSKFTREFYYEIYGNGEIKLTVNIKWEDKGRPKMYTLVERLYSVEYRQFFKPETVI